MLLEKPIVIWDELEQVRSAAERSWVRLDQIQSQMQAEAAGRIYFRWEELLAEAANLTTVEMRELALVAAEHDLHIAARPVQAARARVE